MPHELIIGTLIGGALMGTVFFAGAYYSLKTRPNRAIFAGALSLLGSIGFIVFKAGGPIPGDALGQFASMATGATFAIAFWSWRTLESDKRDGQAANGVNTDALEDDAPNL
ncbi:hypothetical protein [Erythrobacter sp. Alg231-14]|uniref:hypothetical protein n=1 Tax=Erythrobacter sp. Alg231-14 TaxID=1922225 RepID=UPI000D5510C3